MRGLGFLLVAVLLLLVLSAFTDGQWGRGVRGAVRGASEKGAGSVRDRVSAAGSGWLSGRADKTPSTRRTVGKTPPQDTLLSGVLGRLSGLSSRAVRAVRDRVSGQSTDTAIRRPQRGLIVGPDRRAREVDLPDEDDFTTDLPHLEPGERIDRILPDGRTVRHWTYEDQQEEITREADKVAADDLGHKPEQPTQPIPAVPAAEPTHEGDSNMTYPSNGNGHEAMAYRANAIENLNDYRRFVAQVEAKALAEAEDAQAGSDRHRDLSSNISDGMGRLAALNVDRNTIAEGHRVAEQAVLVRDLSKQLAAACHDLHAAANAAKTGAARHDTAQEVANANLLAQRPAYDGA